jgi:hypothetical protein
VKLKIRVLDKFLGKVSIDCEIVLRLWKWVEKVRNYGNWSKILSVLEKGIFDKIIIIIIIIIII